MKLNEIKQTDFTDEEIDKIVYSNTEDNFKNSKYGICFGNSKLLKERTEKAVECYKKGRIEKIIFAGGNGGISNQIQDIIPEAEKMKQLAISLGVPEQNIIVEKESNNTFENIDNSLKLIEDAQEKTNNITLITSEFHLKRCLACFKKKAPQYTYTLISAPDGFSDRENWYLSDMTWNSGRSLATYEAGLLIKYAKEGKIENLNIELEKVRTKYK